MRVPLIFVVVAGAAVAADDAAACTFDVLPSSVPEDGGVVPANPLLLVRTASFALPILIDEDGLEVPTDAAPFSSLEDSGVRLLPHTTLTPDRTYQLADSNVEEGFDPVVFATFRTGDVDDTAPAPPRMRVSAVGFAESLDECFVDRRATVAVEADADVTALGVHTAQAGVGDRLEVFDGSFFVDAAAGAEFVHIDVVALDAAGNSSAPTGFDVAFVAVAEDADDANAAEDAEDAGCGGGAPALFVLPVLIRPRRLREIARVRNA